MTLAVRSHKTATVPRASAVGYVDNVARRLGVGLVVLFSLAPIVVVLAASFTSTQSVAFPPDGFSFRWYQDFLDTPQLTSALGLSLLLAIASSICVVVLSAMAAFALVRYPVPRADAIQSFLLSPLFVPHVLLGLGMLVLFNQLQVPAGMSRLLLAHLVITIPFALRMCLTSLLGVKPSLELAAASLGASRATSLRRITLPLMRPGLLAALMLSFIISFDEVPMSVFISSPGQTTFPALLYTYASDRTTPMLYAASVVLLIVSALVVTVVQRRVGLDQVFLGTSQHSKSERR